MDPIEPVPKSIMTTQPDDVTASTVTDKNETDKNIEDIKNINTDKSVIEHIYYNDIYNNIIKDDTIIYKPVPLTFNNPLVTACYDIVDSHEFKFLRVPLDMTAMVYDSIKAIVNDPEAYAEAKEKWPIFNSAVVPHFEDNKHTFHLMSFEDSVATSLYMYTYH